ncbi:trypsin-like peptidase domain-containing protein [Terrabacter sp. NPDC000476]|uniref:S1C family serine protease n=1 Tax=Terrabacter sp. NPDC000476 TaxID=3154258 RepID=UPI00331E8365
MARVSAPPPVDADAPGPGAPVPTPPRGLLDRDGPDEPARVDPPGRWTRGRRRLAAVPRRAWWWAIVALLVVAVAGAYAATRPPGPPVLTQRDVDASVQRGLAKQAEAEAAAPPDGAVAHAAIAPSLVLIQTEDTVAGRAREGSGAGVVVNEDGTVLTALHVVDGSTAITVTFADGTRSPAKVANEQPENDIATLTPSRLPETVVPATLGGGVQVGTPVFAVGHPLGLVDSLSAGVVSALDRSVRVEGSRQLDHLIQIDAAVNPGNSGGPLLDRAGQVVGIVTGLANPTDQSLFVGIGFAVPISTAGGAAGSPPR